MESDSVHLRPNIRRLWKADRPKLVEHFQRLDPATRRLRFSGTVSDAFIADYAHDLLTPDAVIFGAFPDGELRGISELRGVLGIWPRDAEVALSVEPVWQGAGIGDALLNRTITAARNRRIKTLHMLYLRENSQMQHLSQKHHATLHVDYGQAEATIDPAAPTPLSVLEEMFADTPTYLDRLFHPPS